MKTRVHPSPNFGDRPPGCVPDLIVLHYTATATTQAAIKTLCDEVAEVSAHYVIDPGGEVIALVDEKERAWHAGAGKWGSSDNINDHSIGIEIVNRGDCPFAASQMDALDELIPQIMHRWSISPQRVIGHSDMAPGRKIDPGPRFDWARLVRQGLAVGASSVADAPSSADEPAFFRDLASFGYTAAAKPSELLNSFRLRFRPRHTGPIDPVDCALAADLARRFPVDAPA